MKGGNKCFNLLNEMHSWTEFQFRDSLGHWQPRGKENAKFQRLKSKVFMGDNGGIKNGPISTNHSWLSTLYGALHCLKATKGLHTENKNIHVAMRKYVTIEKRFKEKQKMQHLTKKNKKFL